MKNIYKILIIGILLIALTILTIFNKEKKNGDKLIVAEVTHSVFYAPWYVALEKNYFDDLNIEVILTSGANNVLASVISNDAHIGFCGPEATIYAYDEKDPVLNFASLTKRDGQFLIIRKDKKIDNIKDIEGLTILAGRSGGMPLLSFTNALKKHNINVEIDTSVEFANLSSAFIAGNGDGVNLFEPNATRLVNEGYGYILTSIGSLSKEVPYTAFNAKKSFINNNKDIIKKFYNGINKGLKFVQQNDAYTIAKTIQNQFLDTSFDELVTMIDNYKKYDSWYTSPKLVKEDFYNLEDIMISNKTIDKIKPFEMMTYEVN